MHSFTRRPRSSSVDAINESFISNTDDNKPTQKIHFQIECDITERTKGNSFAFFDRRGKLQYSKGEVKLQIHYNRCCAVVEQR